MRSPKSVMSLQEFERAVWLASKGARQSCNGATDAIVEALDAIVDAHPDNVYQCVRKAYTAFWRERLETSKTDTRSAVSIGGASW